jgi:DNA sulfur modification protein DndE
MQTVENIRLPQQCRDQLIRLKRITGIENWNVLCRWAFCLSLAEKSAPPGGKLPANGTIEMSWRTFAGEFSDVYHALLLQRAHEEKIQLTKDLLSDLLRAHLIRGIGLLTAKRALTGIHRLCGMIARD